METEWILRLVFLVGTVGTMTCWEILAPRRALTVDKIYRWCNNGGIVVLSTLLTRLLFPVGAIGIALDFHRVHHSWHPHETNSNFGFNLSLWDRLLGTYRAQPQDGHEGMTIGINQFRDPVWERLDKMLIQPFIGPADSYPLNRRPEDDPATYPPSREPIRIPERLR